MSSLWFGCFQARFTSPFKSRPRVNPSLRHPSTRARSTEAKTEKPSENNNNNNRYDINKANDEAVKTANECNPSLFRPFTSASRREKISPSLPFSLSLLPSLSDSFPLLSSLFLFLFCVFLLSLFFLHQTLLSFSFSFELEKNRSLDRCSLLPAFFLFSFLFLSVSLLSSLLPYTPFHFPFFSFP